MKALHFDYDTGVFSTRSLNQLAAVSNHPKESIHSLVTSPNLEHYLSRIVFVTASGVTFGFLYLKGSLIGDDQPEYFPLTDGLLEQIPIFRNAAMSCPHVFSMVEEGLPVARLSVDDASVAGYIQKARTNKKYLIGSRAQQVITDFREIDLNEDWSAFDTSKREKYPEFSGVKATLEYHLTEFPNDIPFMLSGTVNMPEQPNAPVFDLIGAFNSEVFSGIFVTCSSDREVSRLYSPYSVAHYKGIEQARLLGCSIADYGQYLPYKEVLGFPVSWLPSLRLTPSVQEMINTHIG